MSFVFQYSLSVHEVTCCLCLIQETRTEVWFAKSSTLANNGTLPFIMCATADTQPSLTAERRYWGNSIFVVQSAKKYPQCALEQSPRPQCRSELLTDHQYVTNVQRAASRTESVFMYLTLPGSQSTPQLSGCKHQHACSCWISGRCLILKGIQMVWPLISQLTHHKMLLYITLFYYVIIYSRALNSRQHKNNPNNTFCFPAECHIFLRTSAHFTVHDLSLFSSSSVLSANFNSK